MWKRNFFLDKEETVNTNSPWDFAINRFLKSCEEGDLEKVKTALDIDDTIFINTATWRDVGLLFACCSGSIDLVNFLITRGCRVNVCNEHGETALHVACLYGKSDLVVALFQHGAKLMLTETGKTCLQYASKSGKAELIDKLLCAEGELGSWIAEDERDMLLLADHEGITALHVACEAGNLAIVKALMKQGASMYSQTSRNETALMIALKSKSTEVVMMLLEEIPESLRHTWINLCWAKDDFDTAVHIASRRLLSAALERLLDLGGSVKLTLIDGSTPLHCACWGDFNAKSASNKKIRREEPTYDETFAARKRILNLLTMKKDKKDLVEVVNAYDQYGMCAAHYICRHGNRHDSVLMKTLLQADFKVDTATTAASKLIDVHHSFPLHEGTTCLHLACANGSLSLVRLLLQKKANPNVQTAQGWTPLHCALHCHKFCNKTVRLINILLVNGADIDKGDKKSKTAMHYATAPHCEESSYHEDIVLSLLRRTPNLNKQDYKGRTPLMNAIKFEMDSDLIKSLLSHGANPNIKDIHHDFPFKLLLDQYSCNRYFSCDESLALEFLCRGSWIPHIDFHHLENSSLLRIIDMLITAGKRSLVATAVVPAIEMHHSPTAGELYKTCVQADPMFLFREKSVLEAAVKESLPVEFPSLYCLTRTVIRDTLAGAENQSIFPLYDKLPLPDIVRTDLILGKNNLIDIQTDDIGLNPSE